MTTARSIIERAARYINVLGQGQTLSANEAASWLETLNDLLGSWSVEGGLVYTFNDETFNLSTTQNKYTIGTGGDFNTARPVEISSAYVSQGGTDYPLRAIGQSEYSVLSDKDSGGTPSVFFYDSNSPTGNIYIWPQPTAGYTITIYSRKALDEFADLNSDINLPTGYNRALAMNLAVDKAAEYEKEPRASLVSNALQAKANVFTANTRNLQDVSRVDSALVTQGGFDIYSD